MRQLTIKGFLKTYLKELSYCNSCSVTKLIKELDSNPRLQEPLIIYAILNNTSEDICKKNQTFYEEYIYIKNLNCNIFDVSDRYSKVYKSYQYFSCKKANDDDTKKKMRVHILQIQQAKCISNYRIYKDLNLNPGNVNNFLKNEACDSLSLDFVRKIWRYVQNY